MVENAVVRARIDKRVKNEAAAVLAARGLTVSDVLRLLMMKIAAEKALPFEPLMPNTQTIEAMKAARRRARVRLVRRHANAELDHAAGNRHPAAAAGDLQRLVEQM